MRPEASPPHQSRQRITAAQDQPPIPRCPPLPEAASTPQPAAFPPLIPRNRDSESSHRNPAANAREIFKALSEDAALAWCKYLGLKRGENKKDKLKVLGKWFEQRPTLGGIYRVTPERDCPCTGCVPTAETVTQTMEDELFSKKMGGEHGVVRPAHRGVPPTQEGAPP